MPEQRSQPAPREGTPAPFGPFVLDRRIASGGTADAFLARPRQGFKPAAQLVIKRLSRRRGRERGYEVLSREAELHQAVRHPNVVTVYGAGMVGAEPYLAMEYVPGVDLHRLLRMCASDNRILPPALAAYIARAIAEALHAVHTACNAAGVPLDITHGDVSPSNIYLSVGGDVKLGDFGVARAAAGSEDGAGRDAELLQGKVGYFAPERLKGGPGDRRSDVFALGVVLGEMLIGESVFAGSEKIARLLSNRDANIEPLRRLSQRLPAPLYRACLRALETEPALRFPDARTFAESLALGGGLAGPALLSEWVSWAQEPARLASPLERRLRHSSGLLRVSDLRTSAPPAEERMFSVRRSGAPAPEELPMAELLELAATGRLAPDDEVALPGEPFRSVAEIPELGGHLSPSTGGTTAQLFEPGVPDYTASLGDTPLLEVLARMRSRRESGALFVTRPGRDGGEERKDLYLSAGRLAHIAGSEREELLGQYLLRLELLTFAELERALGEVRGYEGNLADAVVGLGLLERAEMQRAVRNLARDRVAALCAWRVGHVQLYRGAAPVLRGPSLGLDLTVPMMAAAMLAARRGETVLEAVEALVPGRRHPDAAEDDERGAAPSSLIDVLDVVGAAPTPLPYAIQALVERGRGRGRAVHEREARAAVRVALALEWAMAQPLRP